MRMNMCHPAACQRGPQPWIVCPCLYLFKGDLKDTFKSQETNTHRCLETSLWSRSLSIHIMKIKNINLTSISSSFLNKTLTYTLVLSFADNLTNHAPQSCKTLAVLIESSSYAGKASPRCLCYLPFIYQVIFLSFGICKQKSGQIRYSPLLNPREKHTSNNLDHSNKNADREHMRCCFLLTVSSSDKLCLIFVLLTFCLGPDEHIPQEADEQVIKPVDLV